MAVAVSRRSVWVYSDSDRKATEIDVATNRDRRSTPISAPPVDLSRLAGPMLAADAGGAWLVGIDEQQGPLLTRVPASRGDTRTYALNVQPRAVAVGAGAVWVPGPPSRRQRAHPAQQGDRRGDRADMVARLRSRRQRRRRPRLRLGDVVGDGDVVPGRRSHDGARSARRPRPDGRPAEDHRRDGLGRCVERGRQDAAPRRPQTRRRAGAQLLRAAGRARHGRRLRVELERPTRRRARPCARRAELRAVHDDTRHRAAALGGLCETAIVAGAGAVWVAVGPTLGHRCARRAGSARRPGKTR